MYICGKMGHRPAKAERGFGGRRRTTRPTAPPLTFIIHLTQSILKKTTQMKRITSFLSLLLLTLTGIGTNAVAQDYLEGDPLTTPEEVVGQQVVLRPNVTSETTNKGYGYLSTGDKLSSGISEACLFEFVATGKKSSDGYDLYYLKNTASGQYLKDPDHIAAVKENGDYEVACEWTTDETEAEALVLLPLDATTPYSRAYASELNDYQDLSQGGFVLSRGETIKSDPDGTGVRDCFLYVNAYLGQACYMTYTDTNLWLICTATRLQGYDQVVEYYNIYFPNDVDEDTYPSGDQPGQYKQALVDEAKAACAAANAIMDKGNCTAAEAAALCTRLKAAYEALTSDDAKNPLSEGYYFIYNDGKRWLTTGTQTNSKNQTQEFLKVKDGYTVPDPLDATAAKLIWKVSPAEAEGQFYVQNIYSTGYINGEFVNQDEAKAYGLETDGYPGSYFTLGTIGPIKITCNGTNSSAAWTLNTLNTNTANGATMFHAKYSNGGVMTWNDASTPNNNFHFKPVSADEINNILAEAEQQGRNERLQNIYDKIVAAYNSGTAVKGAPQDSIFDDETALVKDVNQLFSTTTQENDGQGLAGAIDGKFDTYWHSRWDGSAPAGVAHYIGVDLQKAVSTGLSFKVARRATNRLYPVNVTIYACNEVNVESPDEAEWESLGEVAVNWFGQYTTADGKVISDGLGIANIAFSGSYRYFKFALAKNDIASGGEANYMALSEFNVWQGTIDEESSTLRLVSEETRNAVKEEIEKDKPILAAGNATEEDITRAEAVYEKLANELPIPSRLTDAISTAESFAKSITSDMISDEVAYYSQASLDALNAAITAEKAYDTNGKSAAEINAEVEKMNAAVSTFKTSFNLPKPGTYYTFRGRSTLQRNGDATQGWASWNAQIMSYNNSTAENTSAGPLFFTRPDNTTAEDKAELVDTVDAWDNAKYLWYCESSANGQVVLRNVGTGMYLAPHDGKIVQSATAAPMTIVIPDGKIGLFMIDCGNGCYVNAPSWGTLYAYGAEDANDYWTLEEVAKNKLDNLRSIYWQVTPGKMQILTLPVSIYTADATGSPYTIAGITEDNKLVLASIDASDVIPAGTPFLYEANEQDGLDELNTASFDFYFSDDDNITLANDGQITYATEPQPAQGLVGTLCETDTVAANFGYFVNGEVQLTDNTAIPCNSGWLNSQNLPVVSEANGDRTIDLGDMLINAILRTDAIVLPRMVNVYGLNGTLLRKSVKASEATKNLPAGLYIVGGHKIFVK